MARARSRLARQMSERGKVKRAERLFRRSLGLDPDHIEGWLDLGRTLEDLGEAEGARGAYLNVLRHRPGHALALGHYPALLREADDKDGETGPWLARAWSTLGDDATADEAWQAAGKPDERRSRLMAADYLRALRDGAPKRRLRISDKSPLNFFQLALAAVLFPNARVIHCTRDARDYALSVWMENFNVEQRWSTGFDDLAFFTGQYRRLMGHWQEALPLRILEMRYEDTVADVEGQARRLIAFLGVPWDRRCLDFHRSERAVQTPSRWQVRQPIYARSVARWRAYAEHLPELVRAFG